MLFFWLVMTILAMESLLSIWWLRRLWRHVPRGLWRVALAAAVAGIGLSMVWFVASRMGWLPKVRMLTALGMIWGILAAPFGVAPCLLCFAGADVARRYRAFKQVRLHAREKSAHAAGVPVSEQGHLPQPAAGSPAWSRRQMLMAGLAASPLAATYAAAGVGVAQMWSFRRRRLRVPVTGLPAALEGLRILHLSDTHVGGFTPSENLDAIARAVAEEKPDLILFTGDLVDHSNADLPAALAFCEKLRLVAPLFCCEGNHDRIDDPEVLRDELARRRFDWLTEGASRTVVLRGEKIQVIGGSWSFKPEVHAAAVAQAAAACEQGALPILLIHHPDAFDAAEKAGFPLVLSGHTHGGQLMLTEKLGAGSVMFRTRGRPSPPGSYRRSYAV